MRTFLLISSLLLTENTLFAGSNEERIAQIVAPSDKLQIDSAITCMLLADQPMATTVEQAQNLYEQSLRDADAKRLTTVNDAQSTYLKQLEIAKDAYLKKLRADLDMALESKDLALANRINATLKSASESSIPPDAESPLTVAAKEAFASAKQEADVEQRKLHEAARIEFSERLKGFLDAALVSKDLTEANRLNELLANVDARMPDGLQFVQIPFGEFEMGSPPGETGRGRDETPLRVRISRPFEMSIHEITQDQFEFVMGANPSQFKGPSHPVDQVTWEEAVKFCENLTQISRRQGTEYGFRLPTEAEWEYACRAGSTTMFSFGDDPSLLGDHAWFIGNSGGTSHPVGQKNPNSWGLYDMHGNVFEWCQDCYYQHRKGGDDPLGPSSGDGRTLRGGAWYNAPRYHRSANRGQNRPKHRDTGYGFRIVRGPNNGPGDFVGRSILLPVPALGAVTKGNFTAFFYPANPKAKERFHVVIEIRLPPNVREFPISDLSGEINNAGKPRAIPNFNVQSYPTEGFTDVLVKKRHLEPTSKLRIERQKVQLLIPIQPTTKPQVQNIRIRSELLGEEQEMILTPSEQTEQ